PAFAEETRRGTEEDLSRLDERALHDRLQHWMQRTLYDFARDSLKPTALAGIAMGKLEQALQRALGAERTRAALGGLGVGGRPGAEADLRGAVRDLAAGTLDRAVFLQRFGHRGSQEMELAQPRWAEEPALLDRLIGQAQAAPSVSTPADAWDRIAA